MLLERLGGLDQADDGGAPAAVERADHLHPAQRGAGWTGGVRFSRRKFHGPNAVAPPDGHPQASVGVSRYVSADELD